MSTAIIFLTTKGGALAQKLAVELDNVTVYGKKGKT